LRSKLSLRNRWISCSQIKKACLLQAEIETKENRSKCKRHRGFHQLHCIMQQIPWQTLLTRWPLCDSAPAHQHCLCLNTCTSLSQWLLCIKHARLGSIKCHAHRSMTPHQLHHASIINTGIITHTLIATCCTSFLSPLKTYTGKGNFSLQQVMP